jgi:hypothetical protein
MKKIIPALGAFTLALALLASVAVMVASPADARGRKGGGTTTPPPTGGCTVSPNPVAKGATFTVAGSGYGAGRFLTLAITSGGGTSYVWTQANLSGSFSATSRVSTAGSNSVKVHDSVTGSQVGGCSFSSY